jgi:hypothetical protein
MMNLKGFGRKQSRPNRGNIPTFVWEGLRKTAKMLNFSYMNIPCTLLLFLWLEAAKNVAE